MKKNHRSHIYPLHACDNTLHRHSDHTEWTATLVKKNQAKWSKLNCLSFGTTVLELATIEVLLFNNPMRYVIIGHDCPVVYLTIANFIE